MTAISATDTALPARKTVRNCHHDALLLEGMIKAIAHLADDERAQSAMYCLIQIAEERAEALTRDLDHAAT